MAMITATDGDITVRQTDASIFLLCGDYTAIRTMGHKDGWCRRMKPWRLRKIIKNNAVLCELLKGEPTGILKTIGRFGLDVKVGT